MAWLSDRDDPLREERYMNRPSRGTLLAELLKPKAPIGDKEGLADIFRRIKDGTVIPFVGNGLRNDRIFDWWFAPDLTEKRDGDEPILSVDENLSVVWADYIGYPLVDTTNLARVALMKGYKPGRKLLGDVETWE